MAQPMTLDQLKAIKDCTERSARLLEQGNDTPQIITALRMEGWPEGCIQEAMKRKPDNA